MRHYENLNARLFGVGYRHILLKILSLPNDADAPISLSHFALTKSNWWFYYATRCPMTSVVFLLLEPVTAAWLYACPLLTALSSCLCVILRSCCPQPVSLPTRNSSFSRGSGNFLGIRLASSLWGVVPFYPFVYRFYAFFEMGFLE